MIVSHDPLSVSEVSVHRTGIGSSVITLSYSNLTPKGPISGEATTPSVRRDITLEVYVYVQIHL